MSDTIFREEVKNAINATFAESIECEHSAIEALNLLRHEIMALPSAEKTGKWIIDGHHISCNRCGISLCRTDREGDTIPKNFCPNCGARMFTGDTNFLGEDGREEG